MSMIRDPRGREYDRDLGPSGHAYSGHHFLALGDLPTPVDIKRAEDRRIDAERQRLNREARRLDRPICGAVMDRTGDVCARKPGHTTTDHRSRSILDSHLVAKCGRVG